MCGDAIIIIIMIIVGVHQLFIYLINKEE